MATVDRTILRYDRDSRIQAVRSGPPGMLPDEINTGEWWLILTSLNPFLQIQGRFLRDPFPYNCYVLNLKELALLAKYIIFKVYHWKSEQWISPDNTIIVSRYPHPSCILEMEIEFVFSSKQVFKGVSASLDEGALAVQWAGVTDIGENIYSESEFAFGKKGELGDLNWYGVFAEVDGENKAIEEYPHCDKIWSLIKEYDDKIYDIAKELNAKIK